MQDIGFILIVDDNPTNLSVLSQTLKGEGFSVRVAEDGESALQLVERKQPALILLDVQMPGIDGFETCKKLKSEPKNQGIPIIFLTALTDVENKVKGLSLGAVDYISKPFEKEEVLARVRVHLQLKQLTETLEQQVAERTATLEKTQIQLVQQEKLSSLGQLVTGIAHEINNPISCIINNLPLAQDYVQDLAHILTLCQTYYEQLPIPLQEEIFQADLDFILKDLPQLLNSIKISADRIKDISISLRNFARSDSSTQVLFNIHEGLDSTLLILSHRLKPVGKQAAIQLVKEYGNLPQVECYPSQLNQVFMNLLANAIDAIEEAGQQGEMENRIPTLKICTTQPDPQSILIEISDNGMGIPEEILPRVFEPLFTTKPMGHGTGLGLVIAHQIIEKHQGKLNLDSTPGQGTNVKIWLPATS
ncbi:Cyclic di-GMP phosphodiesterase PA4781 [Planktothrix tepida]|uniref:histidine kinase n=2 Tax=Planktothrix TaxID=54304 RepID=A0A1J1LS70_9CYAN|nr:MULTISPECIES: response regulator [Planktothrix]CAD5944939.1 Cyclic di-GMP phosphodiesterase PA4781 [Planktothrix pseudagardhii]CAD5965844.1 Cyclic di-GMP phosphodiesterase PA4781 [Planktothrix tepida]CUR35038.1 Response regulator receiver sensor signal transduction histidine kinase [Planktothrix tepida PCC 9214]